jgi:hypothetical protein
MLSVQDLRFYAHGTGRYQVCFANKFDVRHPTLPNCRERNQAG